MILALKPKAHDNTLSIGLLKASNTSEGRDSAHDCMHSSLLY